MSAPYPMPKILGAQTTAGQTGGRTLELRVRPCAALHSAPRTACIACKEKQSMPEILGAEITAGETGWNYDCVPAHLPEVRFTLLLGLHVVHVQKNKVCLKYSGQK